jgi:FKBP-type peptidyl-prolyl cis-trans isomerase SlyD
MKIEPGIVVTLSYQLSDDSGVLMEQNDDGIPLVYLHGYQNILAGLEEALEGHMLEDKVVVTLPPERAYGYPREQALQKVPVKHLLSKHKRLMPGMLVKVNTEHGARDARIVKAGKFMVEIDTNHPFAGKTLRFDVVIRALRKASDEELAHGHAHGLGGHHH